jgi:hypothetical protein
MSEFDDIQFGRLEPSPEKYALHGSVYSFERFDLEAPAVVEKMLDVPNYHAQYNQGSTPACVGFSCSWQMSLYNRLLYNAPWLYKRACAIDKDPRTPPGTYIWAAMDILRKDSVVVEPGEVEELARELRALAADPDRVRQMGERARSLYRERFGLERSLAAYEALLT